MFGYKSLIGTKLFLFYLEKALWAYSLESLIPSSSTNVNTSSKTQTRQRLASNNIQYFNVGSIRERTFLVYMKKRGLESHFKVLEPIGTGGQRKGMFQMRSDWFKEYKVTRMHQDCFFVTRELQHNLIKFL